MMEVEREREIEKSEIEKAGGLGWWGSVLIYYGGGEVSLRSICNPPNTIHMMMDLTWVWTIVGWQ